MKRLLTALIFFPVTVWAQTIGVAPTSPASPSSAVDPTAKFGTPCAYPDSALRDRATGETYLSFQIASDGTVSDVKVFYPSGNADLDAAAAQCVTRWRSDNDAARHIGLTRGSIVWTIPAVGSDAVTAVGRFKPLAHASCQPNWYPPRAIRAHVEGTAVISIQVGEDGMVHAVNFLQSTGSADLDRATVGCVTKAWRFRPALQNGKPITVEMRYAIQWTLQPDAAAP